MNKSAALSAALASVFALGIVASPVVAAAEGKEKCYGVAKKGANDCASANGSHSCAGQAKADNDPNEWVFVASGTCEKMGGKTAAPKKG
ncbi:DUF2282 domain-containing protein [Methyloversatilis sp.]|uniref:BufA1 family periplasmic bufferin-type metallophore n=1 Tax=Methyloversatilis sp. TaxID=2569862 RepID=UPI0027333CD3|nr:DUF2282 domain-containing protein [Methyloversatilis sp.]MDP2870438.1 DUF2282 domain-containing protein [Methyloversatilis sp.]MDP3288066.1 DUF2282 domain-containing protein [Methyloversatilis sp.]MDP3457243.1 DUF2282 domain-containing protein [Methyloversatilis sp.]MDP3576635.1 DUF2282 domain-containing protein [Methyloversatilis sp.]